MRAAGFDVLVTEVSDTSAARKRLGLPDKFAGCHTGLVAGYVIEGHVPAADVKRRALGMESGNRRDPYEVLLVDKSGGSTVFARYPKS